MRRERRMSDWMGNMPVKPSPFGAWQPSFLSCTIPPSRLIDPTPALIEFSYQQLKAYRLLSAPYIVRVTYDTVNRMIESRIAERKEAEWQRWLQFCKDNV